MTENEPKIYPCIECGVMRTASEGGTTFTICDDCWDRQRPRVVPSFDAPKTLADTIADLRKTIEWLNSQLQIAARHTAEREIEKLRLVEAWELIINYSETVADPLGNNLNSWLKRRARWINSMREEKL